MQHATPKLQFSQLALLVPQGVDSRVAPARTGRQIVRRRMTHDSRRMNSKANPLYLLSATDLHRYTRINKQNIQHNFMHVNFSLNERPASNIE
jgi:hypothetical protein